ncbi:SusC/RagA family TonB-linked outer membrane protein [Flavivirga amylovorans]|uniref:SusC/RagA family TonB-linked outer membrane protein n=1 Tax=Flavivirga amylovorans TaxID=870486 RepID=A0ABT8WX42_9FLAO|nr:SusC/RagA family TonB-linked outer membrane protein [Flavivirga amylovorans]MDO5986233.1 SusC/RagA family TonB-linked outer membrane protein [Flavivirga amylovorans]
MIKTKKIYLMVVGIVLLLPLTIKAQNIDDTTVEEDAVLVNISATVTNQSGETLHDVIVIASKSKERSLTNINGLFNITTQEDDILIISRLGYSKKNVYVIEGAIESETIVLKQWGVIDAEEEVYVANSKMPFNRITGSVERISGEELNDFPTHLVTEALAGRLSGVRSTYGQTSPTSESFGINIRNQGSGQLMVDGIPTATLVLTPAEVGEVIVAKDYGSTFMYGTLGAPGSMIVNTKKGLAGDKSIRLRSRTGVRTPTFLPNTMDAAEYARNFNIALANDGLSPAYTQADIDAYQQGTNPVRNPNNNYYNDLVNGVSTYTHVTGDFSGGNEGVQYFSHLGVYNSNGIESVGDGRKLTRLRLNNNVQIKFGEGGTVDVGIGGSFNKRNEPQISSDAAFSTMYNYPANALPYKINDTIFARSRLFGTNLLEDIAHTTTIEDTRRDAFARLGLNLDLDGIAKGLTLKGQVGLYTLNVLTTVLEPTVTTAEPVFTLNPDGSYSNSFTRVRAGLPDFNDEKLGDRVDRSQFVLANLHYDRAFSDNHKLIADFIYSNQKITGSNLVQNTIFRSLGLKLNHMMYNKYVLELKLINAPVRQLSQDERERINYDVGAAWLLHEESFFKNLPWVDFLKFRANYGVQSRPVSQFFLEEDLYDGGGAGSFGIQNRTSGSGGLTRVFTASNLVAPKQDYLSIGLDFQVLNSKINGQLNYFNIRNYDQVIDPNNIYSLLPSGFRPLENYGDSRFRGVDANVNYTHKNKDFTYKLGVNAMYGVGYVTLDNTLTYPSGEQQRNIAGNQGSRILGLEADGIFQNETEIANAAPQLFGEVKPGDIRYKDFNNDGVIDEKDIHEIGRSPRFSVGLNFMAIYKNWSFSVHGDGQLGGKYIESLNWNRGINDYTNELANSWPVSNSLPRLTTLTNTNNYRTSSFWMKSASYFNVRSIMLSYDLPQILLKDLGINEFRFIGSVRNPFIISSSSDRFLPNRDKGYTESPVLRAFELGLQVEF